MRPINAVLAHQDASSAQQLAASLTKEFRNLLLAKSAHELRPSLARYRAPFAVVDLERISLGQLKEPGNGSPAAAVGRAHRLADGRMGREAVAMGAVDCCQSSG